MERDDGDIYLMGNRFGPAETAYYAVDTALLDAAGELKWRRHSTQPEGCMGHPWRAWAIADRTFVFGWEGSDWMLGRSCLQEVECDGRPRWELVLNEGYDSVAGIAALASGELVLGGAVGDNADDPGEPWLRAIDPGDGVDGCSGD